MAAKIPLFCRGDPCGRPYNSPSFITRNIVRLLTLTDKKPKIASL